MSLEAVLSKIGHAFARTYWRERPIIARLTPFLTSSQSVLDIGAGGCRIARLLSMADNLEVTAVDVIDQNVTDFPLRLYDGKTLPFTDKAFDASILVFVLHHTDSPIALLHEAIRVTRSTILVVEDAPSTLLERLCWRSWDYLLNHAPNNEIAVAHQGRDMDSWVQLLGSAGAPPATTSVFRTSFPVLRTYPHVLLQISLRPQVT